MCDKWWAMGDKRWRFGDNWWTWVITDNGWQWVTIGRQLGINWDNWLLLGVNGWYLVTMTIGGLWKQLLEWGRGCLGHYIRSRTISQDMYLSAPLSTNRRTNEDLPSQLPYGPPWTPLSDTGLSKVSLFVQIQITRNQICLAKYKTFLEIFTHESTFTNLLHLISWKG